MKKIIIMFCIVLQLFSLKTINSVNNKKIAVFDRYRIAKTLNLYEIKCNGCGIKPYMFANNNFYAMTYNNLIIFDKNLNKIHTLKTDNWIDFTFFWKDYMIIMYWDTIDSYRIIFYNKSSFELVKDIRYPNFIRHSVIKDDIIYLFYQMNRPDNSSSFPIKREIKMDIFDLYECKVVEEKTIEYEATNISEFNVNKFNLHTTPDRSFLELGFYQGGYITLILDTNFNKLSQKGNISIVTTINTCILGTKRNIEDRSYTFCRFDNDLETIWQNTSLFGSRYIDGDRIYTKSGVYSSFTGDLIEAFNTIDPKYVDKHSKILNKVDDKFLLVNDGGYQTLWIVDMNMRIEQRFELNAKFSSYSENVLLIGNTEEVYLLKQSNAKMSLSLDKFEYVADNETRLFLKAPYLYKNRLYVDLKSVLESFGGQFYVHTIKEVINGHECDIFVHDMIFYPFKNIRIYPFKPIAKIIETKDIHKEILIDKDKSITPQFDNKIACVPLRFICDRFGLKLSWDQKTKTATVTAP